MKYCRSFWMIDWLKFLRRLDPFKELFLSKPPLLCYYVIDERMWVQLYRIHTYTYYMQRRMLSWFELSEMRLRPPLVFVIGQEKRVCKWWCLLKRIMQMDGSIKYDLASILVHYLSILWYDETKQQHKKTR